MSFCQIDQIMILHILIQQQGCRLSVRISFGKKNKFNYDWLKITKIQNYHSPVRSKVISSQESSLLTSHRYTEPPLSTPGWPVWASGAPTKTLQHKRRQEKLFSEYDIVLKKNTNAHGNSRIKTRGKRNSVKKYSNYSDFINWPIHTEAVNL